MRVLITRPREDGDAIAAHLAALGHQPLTAPLLEPRWFNGPPLDLSGIAAILATSAAGVGLRVSPLPGDHVEFRLGVSPGDMPAAFFAAVEETVRETLRQGLRGWQVSGALVTMTHSGYAPRQSHAHQGFDKSMSSTGADFRGLTPMVTMAALAAARSGAPLKPQRFFGGAPDDPSISQTATTSGIAMAGAKATGSSASAPAAPAAKAIARRVTPSESMMRCGSVSAAVAS